MSFLKYAPKKFWVIAVVAVLAGAGIVAAALLRREVTGRIQAPCGPEHRDQPIDWAQDRIPVPVYFTADFPEEWLPRVDEGLKIADPDKKYHVIRRRIPLSEVAPPYSITVEPVNDEKHGNTHWEVDANCHITKMVVSIPILMRDGHTRACAVAHEFGHGFGFSHSDWERDIMKTPQSWMFPCRLSDTEKALFARYDRGP